MGVSTYTFYGNYYVYLCIHGNWWLFICVYVYLCIQKSHKIVCRIGFYDNSLYNGFSYELLVCDGFFIHIVSCRIIFSMKRGYVCVWEKCEFCGYVF